MDGHQLRRLAHEKLEAEKEAADYRNVTASLAVILGTENGKRVFKYLFKHMSPTGLPEMGLDMEMTRERIGYFRAARSIWELVAAADPLIGSQLLATIEKEKNDEREIQARLFDERK